MDQSKRPRRRLRDLLPRETGPRVPRRRSLARQDPEPTDLSVLVDIVDTYPADAIRRNYAAWGCSPPPPAPTDRSN